MWEAAGHSLAVGGQPESRQDPQQELQPEEVGTNTLTSLSCHLISWGFPTGSQRAQEPLMSLQGSASQAHRGEWLSRGKWRTPRPRGLNARVQGVVFV